LKSPKTGCYDIDTGANRGIDGGNSSLMLGGRDIRLLINSDITSSKVVFGYYSSEAGGEFWLNNTNMIKGYVGISGGLVYLNSTNVVQETPDNTTAWAMGSGSIDLNGNDIPNRDIRFSNNAGVYGVGGIINSNTNQPSVIDGDFTQMSTGGAIYNFNGDGEIILAGNTGVANGGYSLSKGGNGTLRLKGTTTGNLAVRADGGSLILDYSDNTAAKIPNNQRLELNSSDLIIEPNASSAITVEISELYNQKDFGCASIQIASSAGATADLDIDTFDLNKSMSLDISVEDGGAGMPDVLTSDLDDSMKPNVTFNKDTLAQVSSGAVVAETTYTDVADNTTFEAITTIDNLNITGSFTAGTPGASANSLRFDGSYILNLTETLWLSDDPDHNGGVSSILIPEGTGDVEIHGGALDTGLNANTHVFNYDADSILTLGSSLGGYASAGDNWRFVGPGKIVLTNANNNIAGFSMGNGVTVEFAEFDILGGGSSIYLEDATLRYVGSGESNVKTFKLYETSAIDASGSGELEFTSSGDVVTSGYGNYNDLCLTGSGDGSFAGNLKLYMGDLIKTGSGTWTLSATQDYVGKTEILQGTLAIEESVERDMYIAPAGTLSGSPDIGRDFETEGTVIVDLTAGKTITVGCTATLGGSIEFDGILVQGEEFVVLEATTIVGSFDNIPAKYDVIVAGNEVVVTLAPPQGTLLIVQ
jgi:autotransporter-associated beta strand protein